MSKPKRKIISSLDEVPASFASEDEEREWWHAHEFSEELYDKLQRRERGLEALLKSLAERRKTVG